MPSQTTNRPFVGAQHVGILIERADAPGMSACADPQPHGPVIYKDCADRSEMPKWFVRAEIRLSWWRSSGAAACRV
jgi:hypothetical protein